MQQRTLLVLLALIIVIGSLVAFYMVESRQQAVGPGTTGSSTPSLVGLAIFTDGEHGFSLRFPQADQTDYSFDANTHLPPTWRVGALATGTPIIAIASDRISNAHAYPRFFDSEIRIGASNEPKEVSVCGFAGNGETALPDVSLGGATFKAFSFDTHAAGQYLSGVSYRTVHDGSCIAIEKLETGSSYHDDPPSRSDVPQAKLDAAYAALDPIIASFSFSRP